MEELTKKKRRCNSSAWLQIFGGVSAVGGIITAAVTGGLWPIIGGASVAVGSVGVFLTGWYKDSRSLLKLFRGTSKQEDMLYEAKKQKQKKIKKEEKLNSIKNFLDEIEPCLDQNFGFENTQNIFASLKAAKKYLKYKAPNYEDGSLLDRVISAKNRFNEEQQAFINSNQTLATPNR